MENVYTLCDIMTKIMAGLAGLCLLIIAVSLVLAFHGNPAQAANAFMAFGLLFAYLAATATFYRMTKDCEEYI